VPRLGYGTMRLTGPGVLGPPPDRTEALLVLQRALELGIRAFDTAWYYGPDIPNQLLVQTLRAHPHDVVIATKLGWEWERGRLVPAHSPAKLREGMQRDLRVLGGASIALVHLRWGNDTTTSEPFRRAVSAMIEMREAGSFQHIGLSNVGFAQVEYALGMTEIASVSTPSASSTRPTGTSSTSRHGTASPTCRGCRCEPPGAARLEPSALGRNDSMSLPHSSRSRGFCNARRTSCRSPGRPR
jgi:aryl-alcohol dehydrogenase-like predicted oxidoreductase